MKQTETPSDGSVAMQVQAIRSRQHRRHQYHRVHDERKRAVRGLWMRNGRYYAQLTLEDLETGRKRVRRVPLEGATTPAQAREKLDEFKVGRRKGSLSVLKCAPKFEAFAEEYERFYAEAKDAKRASTLETEKPFRIARDRACRCVEKSEAACKSTWGHRRRANNA